MVGSDKERPKGRVGSGSDNARGSPILSFNLTCKLLDYVLVYLKLNILMIIVFQNC